MSVQQAVHPGLDLGVLTTWLPQNGVQVGSDLSAQLITGGQSNLTYVLSDGAASWVLRRPPVGDLPATAHDVIRECTVMRALSYTDVPVPSIVAECQDPALLGQPFFLMEQIQGTSYRRRSEMEALGPTRTDRVAGAMVEVLARLHRVRAHEIGLDDFGRPTGFVERQVRRWVRQLDAVATTERRLCLDLARELSRLLPPDDASWHGIVHGDFRLDNLLIGEQDDVRAVIDWEMATLGDVRTDLALLVVYDEAPRRARSGVAADVSTAPGYPDAATMLERYAAHGGRVPDELGFFVGLAYFKLAVIYEGIHRRALDGNAVGAGLELVGEDVDVFATAGLEALAHGAR